MPQPATNDAKADIARSVFIGAIRFVIPSVLYLILCRVILKQWGLELFGLWSIFAAAASYAALTDIGLSQTLMREAGRDVEAGRHFQVVMDRTTAGLFYIILTPLVLFLAVWLYIRYSNFWSGEPYSFLGMLAAVVLTIVGTGIKQYAKLDMALAAAYGANAATVAIQGYGQVVLLIIALVASASYPIEGLAIGIFLSGCLEAILARRASSNAGFIYNQFPRLTLRQSALRISQMVMRGRYLYLSNLGSTIREPLFRTIIVGFFGLVVIGYFDIALRITRSARDIGVLGLSSTFPLFARYQRLGSTNDLREAICWTLSLSVILGTIPLASVLAVAPAFYLFWLADQSETLINTTMLLSWWLWLTLSNVPFWHAALASRMDGRAAVSVWIHAGSVFSLLILVPFAGVGYLGALALWVAGSFVTQLAIVLLISSKLGLGKIFTRNVCLQMGGSCVLMCYSSVLASSNWSWSGIGSSAVLVHFSIFAALVGCLVWVGRREVRLLFGLALPNLKRA